MPKRVAIIGTRGYPSYYGGFETAVRHVAPALADAGWDVTVYGRPGQERADDPSLDPRITRRTTRGLESRSLSTLTHGLSAVLDTIRRRPDVALVMNCANGYWLPLLKLAGISTVVNVDGIEWERAKWGRFAKAVFKTGARMTAWTADRLVFDADAIGADSNSANAFDIRTPSSPLTISSTCSNPNGATSSCRRLSASR